MRFRHGREVPQPASGRGRESTRRDVHRDFEAEPDIFELGLGPQHGLPQGWSTDDRVLQRVLYFPPLPAQAPRGH
jgi:hypothetical protein